MQYLIRYTLISTLLILIFSCNNLFEDDPFYLKKLPNQSNKLKTNGYYYNYIDLNKDSSIYVFIIYRNGIAIKGFNGASQQDVENEFANGQFYIKFKNYKMAWGIYEIDSNNISIEHLVPTGGLNNVAEIRSGIILNDSTFQLTKMKYSWIKGTETIDKVYHFKSFSPKPDSVNVFIP